MYFLTLLYIHNQKKNHEPNAYSGSMLSDNLSFNTFDFSLVPDANDDLNFDEFITNCEAINYESSSISEFEEESNLEDVSLNLTMLISL